MKKEKYMHFRIDTPTFFKEVTENALIGNMGILKRPLQIFINHLGQAAQRAAKLNDPILNKVMFDMNLYELPSPSNKEYSKLMKKVYKLAEEQEKKEKTK